MKDEKIKIVIDENGEIFVETDGILGPACVEEITKIMKDAAIAIEANKTDEYHMEQKVKTTQQQKTGLKK